MDVTDVVARLLRRWVATLHAIALAVLAAGLAWTSATTTQQSTAAVVIVPPYLGEAISDQNPLLNLSNNLSQLATVLAASMAAPTPSERAGLADGAVLPDGVTYTISTVTGTNPSFAQLSPQLVFTVTAPTAESAERGATVLVAEAESRLDGLQTQVNAPLLARARLVTVVAPTVAEPAGSSRVRAAGAVGLGVLVLGLLAVLLVDELLSRRAERRRTRRVSRPPP